jgi:carboxyl-terminal processing protease
MFSALFQPCARIRAACVALAILFAFGATAPPSAAQAFRDDDRARGRTMLDLIKKDVLKHYYDPAYHGVDVEARFKAASDRIQQASSNGEIFSIIAQVLVDFKDSHLYFVPPSRSARVEYGWRMGIVGDKCLVTAVKPGSDAAAKGLKPGDLIHSVDGFAPTRENLWLLKYLYYTLRPRPAMQVIAVDPAGKARELAIEARVTQGRRVLDLADGDGTDLNALIREAENEAENSRHRYITVGEDALVWKMPQFDLPKKDVDKLLDEAKGRQALIVDMRGNGGGSEETMLRLIGNLFDTKLQVGTLKRRTESKPLLAESRGGDKVFKGKVIVLVDAGSGSAAEVFARVLQLEKRGTVIGDVSSGSVMRSRSHSYKYGVDTVVFYGASITDADVIMSDGKSLERVGVQPDELLLPSAADLAAGLDPVMARAFELAGLSLDAKAAGSMFPIEWEK